MTLLWYLFHINFKSYLVLLNWMGRGHLWSGPIWLVPHRQHRSGCYDYSDIYLWLNANIIFSHFLWMSMRSSIFEVYCFSVWFNLIWGQGLWKTMYFCIWNNMTFDWWQLDKNTRQFHEILLCNVNWYTPDDIRCWLFLLFTCTLYEGLHHCNY